MAVANESTVIAEAVQDIYQGMTEFASTSVHINSWDWQDESEENSPWVLIEQVGLNSSLEESMDCVVNTWTIPSSIYVPFLDWNSEILELATLRNAVLTTFAANRNLGLVGYFNLRSRSDATPTAPIRPVFDEGSGLEMPFLLALDLVMEVITRD